MPLGQPLSMGRLQDALSPFVHPRISSRKKRPKPLDWPEQDRLTIEVDQGDWWRLCVIAGHMKAEDFDRMPWRSRPGIEFVNEMRELEAAMESSRAYLASLQKKVDPRMPGEASGGLSSGVPHERLSAEARV